MTITMSGHRHHMVKTTTFKIIDGTKYWFWECTACEYGEWRDNRGNVLES